MNTLVGAVSFDADEALYKFRQVMRRALESTLALMVARGDVAEGSVTTADLREARNRLAVEVAGFRHDMADIRRPSFEVVLAEHGHSDPAEAASTRQLPALIEAQSRR